MHEQRCIVAYLDRLFPDGLLRDRWAKVKTWWKELR